jgi:hypothetical protein
MSLFVFRFLFVLLFIRILSSFDSNWLGNFALFFLCLLPSHYWVNRTYAPIRQLSPVVSFTAFRTDVEQAISFRMPL